MRCLRHPDPLALLALVLSALILGGTCGYRKMVDLQHQEEWVRVVELAECG